MVPKSAPPTPIHLEGTTLEGGGQLLRIALGLSALTKKPINITNVRGKRSGGEGLKAQHLTCVQWLGQACNARLSGVGLKSKEITFVPKQDGDGSGPFDSDGRGEDIRINQNTPGSINLVLQAILPYLLFSGASSPIRVRITGGTNVSNSPSHDYIVEVLLPILALIGIPPIEAQVHSRGWSQGGTCLGSATFIIKPLTSSLPGFQLRDRGEIKHVKASVIAPRETEQHFRDELDLMFEKREACIFGADNDTPEIDVTFEPSHHEKRYYILLVATSSTGIKLGRDWLYDQGFRPGKTKRIVRTMVKKVSDDLVTELARGGCVDEYMRDQLVVFQALAEGQSNVHGGRSGDTLAQPSLHARTATWVAKEMIGVEFNDEGACEGIGYHPGRDEGGGLKKLAEDMEKLNVSVS